MKSVFDRRVVPVLLLAQIVYIGLLEFAFAFLVPDTGELDHAESGSAGLLGYGVLVTTVLIVVAGGAVLLASTRVSASVPRVLRMGWLILLGILETGIAVVFIHSAVTGSLGPDTLIAGAAVVVSGCVGAGCVMGAAACLRGARHALP
ncbi:hypothetical protein C1I97_18750 [Streptomyces sp. NTH33]|uniref:hypothetical protein n=1 Tax=Streptomyces sp. NTH33 TaxID=1735453 RepID=UPI000DA9F8D4|nr:hypothetical protein [Streptomyces sp. NTH33]PZH05447.1 hypothetical protein C1I97_18750 [Streptomyces sp. NTH33]